MKTIKLSIAVRCSSCVVNIKKVLNKHVITLEVNLALKIAKIKYDNNSITKKQIIRKIQEIGYDANEID